MRHCLRVAVTCDKVGVPLGATRGLSPVEVTVSLFLKETGPVQDGEPCREARARVREGRQGKKRCGASSSGGWPVGTCPIPDP